MPGGDTIQQAVIVQPTIRTLLADAALRGLCKRLGHRWREYKRPNYAGLPFGKREWCERCKTNRITFPDGEVVEASAPEIVAGETRFAEALYEARWGEPPRRKLRIGEWPAP